MNTKTCKGCGWVYPITHPDVRCRFCGTLFEKRFCPGCGAYLKLSTSSPYCNKCRGAMDKQNYPFLKVGAKNLPNMRAVQRFNDWMTKVSKVELHTLTEEEWLKACRYFGKCALCPSERIDARSFFISFELGGRYAAWNVLPVCELCANDMKRSQNPFIHYTTNQNKARARNNFKTDNFENAVKYLTPLLDEVSNDGT